MSISDSRDGLLTSKRNERKALARRRTSRLLALKLVTSIVTSHTGLPPSTFFDVQDENARTAKSDIEGREPTLDITLDAVQQILDDAFRSEEASKAAAATTPPSADVAAPKQTRSATPVAEKEDGIVEYPDAGPSKLGLTSNGISSTAGTSDAAPEKDVVVSDKPPRMQTRVSSGAMRQKSVSEILQEPSKSTPKRKPSALIPQPSPAVTARPTPSKMMPPPPARPAISIDTDRVDSSMMLPGAGYTALTGAAEDPNRDYLEPLYRIQAQDPPNGRSLGELLHKASKSVNTSDALVSWRERQDQRILKRIYTLQYSNMWSLRQMEPVPQYQPAKTHWDHLLGEAKWMRTDFRQERKEKRRLAKYYAGQCATWIEADSETRSTMQVRIRKSVTVPHTPADARDEQLPELDKDELSSVDADGPATPQFALISSAVLSSSNITPDNIQLLESEDFVNAIQGLPLYTPFNEDPPLQKMPEVSKYSSAKIMTKTSVLKPKRSRFDCDEEDEEDDAPPSKRTDTGLPPEQNDVALFDPEHKHIKDRLRASTAFRPPSEFPMPAEKFYEWRLASSWTYEDDHRLRKLAKDYCFNWSMIADRMTLPSHFHGAPDRRTPWECFERWVELEQLPQDMRKTVYFRTWANRLENAARSVDARYQAQVQAHSQSSSTAPPPMKRRTMPTKVERRRTGRYLHVVDAMRKLARKRENQQHKQAEAQKAASMRKQQETVQSKTTIHTPQEFSRLRYERDVQMQIRAERMREQMLAQQKHAQMQRSGQAPQAQAQQQQQRQGPMPQNRTQIPQAQMQAANMRANGNAASQEAMQRMAMQAQMSKNHQQQIKQYQMLSPGNQQMGQQGAMVAQMQGNSSHGQMAPPNGSQPKQLSSGLIPAINQIKHTLQAQHPQATQQQIDQMANDQMKRQIHAQQARQSAVNAASGNYNMYQQHAQQQQQPQGQQNQQQQQQQQQQTNGLASIQQNGTQQQYSQMMRQRLIVQQQQLQQAGQGNPSPRLQQATPVNMHISPVMQQAVPNVNGQRPPSRTTAPQMVRIPSGNGMISPGMPQGSPRPQMVKQG